MAMYKKGERVALSLGKRGKPKRIKKSLTGGKDKEYPSTESYPIYEWDGTNWRNTNEFTEKGKNPKEFGFKTYKDVNDIPEASATAEELGSGDWGAANIGKDDFVDPATGEQRSLMEVAQLLDPKLPNITGEKLINQIKEMMPKYVGVSAEEKGFLEEETAQAFKGDVYGLQKEAGKVGGAMASAVGSGMGAGMRSGMAGQASMGKGFGMAEDAYDLAKRKGTYALEQKAETGFETDVKGFLEDDWFTTPAGGEKKLTDWEDYAAEAETAGTEGDYREGGRVPNKEGTFLNFLIQLPDAGGS